MSDVNKQLLEALKGMVFYVFGDLEAGKSDVCDELRKLIAAAEQAQQSKAVTLEQLVANLKAGENGDAISAAMDQACADMELGRRMREQAQQAEPRCACGDSFTSAAVCANCLAAQQAQWLPIETAPRDETPILAYAKSVFGVVDISEMFFVDGDWYWFRDGEMPDAQPSHWMPLPPEPKP